MEQVQGMLRGKRIMVTGASSGIGASAARLFAAEGAAVVLMARREDRLAELAAGIRAAGGRAEAVAGDVTATADVERAVTRAVEAFGGLDGAFNNAGFGARSGPACTRRTTRSSTRSWTSTSAASGTASSSSSRS